MSYVGDDGYYRSMAACPDGPLRRLRVPLRREHPAGRAPAAAADRAQGAGPRGADPAASAVSFDREPVYPDRRAKAQR